MCSCLYCSLRSRGWGRGLNPGPVRNLEEFLPDDFQGPSEGLHDVEALTTLAVVEEADLVGDDQADVVVRVVVHDADERGPGRELVRLLEEGLEVFGDVLSDVVAEGLDERAGDFVVVHIYIVARCADRYSGEVRDLMRSAKTWRGMAT